MKVDKYICETCGKEVTLEDRTGWLILTAAVHDTSMEFIIINNKMGRKVLDSFRGERHWCSVECLDVWLRRRVNDLTKWIEKND